jgi:uncharacterized membrane protein
MVEISESATDAQLTVLTRPNRSMSWLGTVYLIMLISLFLMVVAIGFSLVGAWPVIIFTIATIICLSLGFQHVWKKRSDYERLTIQDGKLSLEYNDGGQVRCQELNAHWVRVSMDNMPDGNCRQLTLLAHGNEISFGRHLCDETKRRVGLLLKVRLGSGFNPHGIKVLSVILGIYRSWDYIHYKNPDEVTTKNSLIK